MTTWEVGHGRPRRLWRGLDSTSTSAAGTTAVTGEIPAGTAGPHPGDASVTVSVRSGYAISLDVGADTTPTGGWGAAQEPHNGDRGRFGTVVARTLWAGRAQRATSVRTRGA